MSEVAPAALDHAVAADSRCPNPPGGDDLRDGDEHERLVALGEHVGGRIVRLFDGVSP
jgi:hypothetical protein